MIRYPHVFLDRFFKDPAAKTKKLLPIVERINALEESIHALSDTALLEKSVEFKKRLASGEMLDDLLPEAFAVVREAAQRTLSQRHFDVQLIGGMILHERGIAEMKTGEGKTLVATLPAYLNALTGRGVHVVTVNDYLSRRDATWMGQVYNALGLTVGVLNHDTSYLYDPAHTEKDTERDLEGSFRVVHEFLRPATKKRRMPPTLPTARTMNLDLIICATTFHIVRKILHSAHSTTRLWTK